MFNDRRKLLEIEIYDSIPDLTELILSAEGSVIELREEDLDAREKGRFPNGGIDYVTRVDTTVGR